MITRQAQVPVQDFGSVRLTAVAGPANGAQHCIVLRGQVAVGADFPAHSHDREEVLYFLAGSAGYAIGAEPGTVEAGDVVLVPAGALHRFDARDDVDAIAVLPIDAKTFAPDGSLMEQRV